MELIDRDALLADQRNITEFEYDECCKDKFLSVDAIRNAPIVGTREHGEWCEIRIGWVPVGDRCSNCYKRSDENAPYCPNCGAKMYGGKYE